MQDLIIRRESKDDYRAVENVTREAFYNVYRPGCVEHYVLNQYRDRADFIGELDLLCELDGTIIGHVMFARAEIELENGEILPIATFGPFSILPKYQGRGYGSRLLRYALAKAKDMGIGAVAITGDYNLYHRYGFEKGKGVGIKYVYDETADYFLVAELIPSFLKGCAGTYKDPDGYMVNDVDAEAFDATFEPKEKIKSDTQIF